MPEHAQAHQSAQVRRGEAPGRDLDHQRRQPDEAKAHMEAVGPDKGEEGGVAECENAEIGRVRGEVTGEERRGSAGSRWKAQVGGFSQVSLRFVRTLS